MAKPIQKRPEKAITTNRKARHDYHIIDSIEAGIALTGTEVKSLREGKASLSDAYAKLEDEEVWLINANIPQFKQGSYFNHEPKRKRKLLLHRSQIRKLDAKVLEKGLTIIPLRMYFSGPYIKVELGIARGKKEYDKRESIKERDVRREVERTMAAHKKR
jgi:SsrA-binding protein